MPSCFIPTDNGKYDFLIEVSLAGCTVTLQTNEGRQGEGAMVFCEVREFSSEAEAQNFFQEQCRRDPHYSPPTDEEVTLQRGESVYLTFSDTHSHKFYEVTVSGADVLIRYGRIGSKGQLHHSTETTAEAALSIAIQKINDKLKKGYVRSPSPSALPPSQQSESSQSTLSVKKTSPSEKAIKASPLVLVLPITLHAGEEMFWQIVPLKPGVTVQIAAISHSPLFSFNLMASEDFAYHLNSRSAEAQIIQNTRIKQNWGGEERIPLPQDMAFGQTFELTISVQDTNLLLYLNGVILHYYRHRISPTQLDGLRLICSQGHLQILSIQGLELASLPDGQTYSSSSLEEPDIEEPDTDIDAPELDIAQFIRSAWHPIVVEGDGDRLASKFGGRPWLAIDEPWPTCPSCTHPMPLFLQLHLDNLPEPVREEFGSGLLQVFYCVSNNCQPRIEAPSVYYGRLPYLIQNVKIRLIHPLGSGSTLPLPEVIGEHYKAFSAKTIIDWQIIEDYPDPDDLVAQVYGWHRLSEENLWDEIVERFGINELIDYEDQYPTNENDKLGGYPRWVQGMECPGCPVCSTPMRQVFQLASCNNLDYMFGDMGIAHLLQCQIHKNQFAFVWACG